jgi:hypothetical protein
MTWRVSQTGASFSGAMTMSDTGTGKTGIGSVAGTVNAAATIQFRIAVPVGGFENPYDPCRSDVAGEGTISSVAIAATYSGTNSCTGSIDSGKLFLQKSR